MLLATSRNAVAILAASLWFSPAGLAQKTRFDA